jgi:hypothetical protein
VLWDAGPREIFWPGIAPLFNLSFDDVESPRTTFDLHVPLPFDPYIEVEFETKAVIIEHDSH